MSRSSPSDRRREGLTSAIRYIITKIIYSDPNPVTKHFKAFNRESPEMEAQPDDGEDFVQHFFFQLLKNTHENIDLNLKRAPRGIRMVSYIISRTKVFTLDIQIRVSICTYMDQHDQPINCLPDKPNISPQNSIHID